MKCGIMTMRQLTLTHADPIIGVQKFYYNENQFSDNFYEYLRNNPIKNEFLKRIYIHDLPIADLGDSWRCVSKSAQIRTNPEFNITNGTN